MSIFDGAVQTVVLVIEQIGYLGIFIGMLLESTPFPLPSELVMIPAGMSAAQGGMNIYLVIFFGTLGNLAGAIICYYLAKSLGRKVLLKVGKYFFIKPEVLLKIENYFHKHGNVSVFMGRLILGFRHLISVVAGVAKMPFGLFCFYTAFGSLVWNVTLTCLGYYIGYNQELIKEYLGFIVTGCVAFCFLLVLSYYFLQKKSSK